MFYNIEEIKKNDIKFPSIYFEPNYCCLCEKSDNGYIEYCLYKELIFVYIIKKDDNNNNFLISPYGYSGLYFEKNDTFNDFLKLFIEYLKKHNYKNVIIRQNPFFKISNNVLKQHFNLKKSKTLFCIKLDDTYNFFDSFLYNSLKSKKRNIYTKAIKNKYQFIQKKIDIYDVNKNSIFRQLYDNTMNKVNANNYYYFNEKYFEYLASMNNTIFTFVKKEHEILGCAIIFLDNNYVHYHLSCNNQTSNCITYFLILEIIKNFCKGKIFNLGCGITNDDSLHKFKQSLSNATYDYNIYEINNFH
jgi:hypothetical protein